MSENFYLPPNSEWWQGRKDAPPHAYFFQIIELLNLNQSFPTLSDQTLHFVLLGFCSDEGVKRNQGREGANEGPEAIRSWLGKLAVRKKHVHCYDAGNIICANHKLEEAQKVLGDTIALFLKHGMIPIVLGGGHELAWGNFQGIVQEFGKKPLGIINFDAHFDMRPLVNHQGNSGTPFLQIAEALNEKNRAFDYNCIGIQPASNTAALFATAKKYHTQFVLAGDVHQDRINLSHFLQRIIDDNEVLYLSLCLDVLASAYAPGVSAPQALGLTPWQIIPLLRQAATSGKVVSYDIAELAPSYDQDHRTAKLAANFVYEIIHHHQEKIHGQRIAS